LLSVVLCIGGTVWFIYLGRRDREISGEIPMDTRNPRVQR
jgi:hypothetical protein